MVKSEMLGIVESTDECQQLWKSHDISERSLLQRRSRIEIVMVKSEMLGIVESTDECQQLWKSHDISERSLLQRRSRIEIK